MPITEPKVVLSYATPTRLPPLASPRFRRYALAAAWAASVLLAGGVCGWAGYQFGWYDANQANGARLRSGPLTPAPGYSPD